MNKLKTMVFKEKIQGILFFGCLLLGSVLVGASGVEASWDINSTDNRIRQVAGTILFLVAAFLAIRAYAKGRKGVAIGELLVGAFLGIFIASPNPLQTIQGFFSGIFGF